MTDPTIPISAMAAVTKNLGFAITASTSFEPPFLLAKRFSSLDHFTKGRIGESKFVHGLCLVLIATTRLEYCYKLEEGSFQSNWIG
jgi:hypothetical protein